MKFLLDCCATSRTLHTALVDLGHHVLSAREGYSAASDESIQDTVLHEIAHALAAPEAGHGPLWKTVARRIGAAPMAKAHETDPGSRPSGSRSAAPARHPSPSAPQRRREEEDRVRTDQDGKEIPRSRPVPQPSPSGARR